jgi:hypothetical protein
VVKKAAVAMLAPRNDCGVIHYGVDHRRSAQRYSRRVFTVNHFSMNAFLLRRFCIRTADLSVMIPGTNNYAEIER